MAYAYVNHLEPRSQRSCEVGHSQVYLPHSDLAERHDPHAESRKAVRLKWVRLAKPLASRFDP